MEFNAEEYRRHEEKSKVKGFFCLIFLFNPKAAFAYWNSRESGKHSSIKSSNGPRPF